MTELVLASRNAHKIREVSEILESAGFHDFRLLSLDDIGFFGEIEESGETFEENALTKAAVPASLGYIGIADDSGLTVDALNGAPGVYSARYAGEHGDDEANNQKVLSELYGLPAEQRGGAFVCVVALVLPKNTTLSIPQGMDASHLLQPEAKAFSGGALTVRGESRGEILTHYAGSGGFGYDPLFYKPEFKKTFAELTAEEKNAVSHRGIAVRKLAEILSDMTCGRE